MHACFLITGGGEAGHVCMQITACLDATALLSAVLLYCYSTIGYLYCPCLLLCYCQDCYCLWPNLLLPVPAACAPADHYWVRRLLIWRADVVSLHGTAALCHQIRGAVHQPPLPPFPQGWPCRPPPVHVPDGEMPAEGPSRATLVHRNIRQLDGLL